MRVLRPLFVVCSALFIAVSVSAQSTSTTSSPQALALVRKSLAALNDGAPVTDITLTGTVRRIAGSDDETGTATLEATSAGDSRTDLSFASGNRIEIRNHAGTPLANTFPPGLKLPSGVVSGPQPVGEWIGRDGAPHAMAGQNIMTPATWFFPAITLEKLAASQNYVLTYLGQETHNGATVLHVSAAEEFPTLAASSSAKTPRLPFASMLQHLTQMDFYFDPKTLLPVALDFNEHPNNNALVDIPVEILFSDYQQLNGLTVPMKVQKYLNSSLLLDLQFTGVTTNSGLSTSAFAIQ